MTALLREYIYYSKATDASQIRRVDEDLKKVAGGWCIHANFLTAAENYKDCTKYFNPNQFDNCFIIINFRAKE